MLRVAQARPFLAVQRLNAHQAHQPARVPATNAIAEPPQQVAHHAGTGKRIVCVQPVDFPH